MTLYELTQDYKILLDMAEDPDVDPEALADTMEGIEGAIEDKADAYAAVMREMEGDAAKIDIEIERLKYRKQAIKANIDRIKANLMTTMLETGKTKFKTALNSFSLRKSGQAPVEILPGIDPDDVPLEYQRVKVTRDFDKTAIRGALKEGAQLQWAKLGEPTESLIIR
jgi:hypothetical protein